MCNCPATRGRDFADFLQHFFGLCAEQPLFWKGYFMTTMTLAEALAVQQFSFFISKNGMPDSNSALQAAEEIILKTAEDIILRFEQAEKE